MPYFKWIGIDFLGKDHAGLSMARSSNELEENLHKYHLGLVKHQQLNFKARARSKQEVIKFFQQLALLLESGVFLDQALSIIEQQTTQKQFKKILQDMIADVEYGNPLGNSMQHYPAYFDAVTVQVILSGHESGRFIQALNHITDYHIMITAFYKKFSSALMIPIITLGFFIFITAVIFIFIIPAFASMFLQANQELPTITQIILGISNNATLIIGASILVCISLAILLYTITKLEKVKLYIDALLFSIPWLGILIRSIHCAHFCTSMSLLLKGNIPLVPALHITAQCTNNVAFKRIIQDIYAKQCNAIPLDIIVLQYPTLFPEIVRSLFAMGQESNSLPTMFHKAADFYQDIIDKKLSLLTFVIQPLLMIILGLMITLLIFAVYIPIFNLSWSVA